MNSFLNRTLTFQRALTLLIYILYSEFYFCSIFEIWKKNVSAGMNFSYRYIYFGIYTESDFCVQISKQLQFKRMSKITFGIKKGYKPKEWERGEFYASLAMGTNHTQTYSCAHTHTHLVHDDSVQFHKTIVVAVVVVSDILTICHPGQIPIWVTYGEVYNV